MKQLADSERIKAIQLEPLDPRGPLGDWRLGSRDQKDRDRVGVDSPRAEHERLDRGGVNPVSIVDADQERLPFGCRREQTQRRPINSQAVQRAGGTEAKRTRECRRLPFREFLEMVEQPPRQVCQDREAELRLGLHSTHREASEAVGALADIIDERALAYPRPAGDDQRTATAVPGRRDPCRQTGLLRRSPRQHVRMILNARRRTHPSPG
jgi:hypothetical protein